jgi:hypothetical protein
MMLSPVSPPRSLNDRPGDTGSCPGGTTVFGVSIANFSSFLSKSEFNQPGGGTSRFIM